MQIIHLKAVPLFEAPDGSTIREVASPSAGGLERHSLAHITIPAGGTVPLHYHKVMEEVYHVLSGKAQMHLDGAESLIAESDTVRILPGQVHGLTADAGEPLVMLVSCAPAWSPDDQFPA